MQLYGSLNILWHCLSFRLEWKRLFQSCGHCWVFQICWHIECNTFTALFSRVWNSSAGIPSPPLALFVVLLPKAHLTSHARMFGSRWVTTPLWLSRSFRTFLCSSSVYSCHPFLMSCACIRSLLFLSFIVPIFAWNFRLLPPIFLKKSLVFTFLLFSSISLHCSLRKVSYLPLLFSGTLHSVWHLSHSPLPFTSLLSQVFVRPPPATTLPSWISISWWYFWLPPPVQCYKPPSIVLQVPCLSYLIPRSLCHLHCIIVKNLI